MGNYDTTGTSLSKEEILSRIDDPLNLDFQPDEYSKKNTNPSSQVLVTGITGFLGSQIAHLLLLKNYKVKGTVRSLKNEKKLQPIKSLPNQQNLSLIEADLLNPNQWDEAIKGCDYVLHVASPFPTKAPKNENDLILPAVGGTTNVLKAVANHPEIKHVVVTSSIAAIMSCGEFAKKSYDENDWPNPNGLLAYSKSKMLAEKKAWELYEEIKNEKIKNGKQNEMFKMTVINPAYIFGPTLVNTSFSSGDIIRQILTGDIFGLPKMHMGIVDVRDVAIAHVLAMENDQADGKRYICATEGHLWLQDIANILCAKYQKYGYKVQTAPVRYYTLKLATFWDSQAESAASLWDSEAIFHNEKIKQELGMKFRSAKEAILSIAQSLIDVGIVENLVNKK